MCAHIRSPHEPEFASSLAASLNLSCDAFYSLANPRRTQAAHTWIEFIVLALLHFSVVEHDVFLRSFKLGIISRNTLISPEA